MADAPPAGERGGFDRGFGGRGGRGDRGRGDRGRGDRGRGRGRGRGRKDDGEEKWVPVTKLGRLVQQVKLRAELCTQQSAWAHSSGTHQWYKWHSSTCSRGASDGRCIMQLEAARGVQHPARLYQRQRAHISAAPQHGRWLPSVYTLQHVMVPALPGGRARSLPAAPCQLAAPQLGNPARSKLKGRREPVAASGGPARRWLATWKTNISTVILYKLGCTRVRQQVATKHG
jgi:hypothetical protein